MGNLRLQLLGAFRLQRRTGEAVLLPTKKCKALLAYLALSGGQPHTRSSLASLFWDQAPERQARESLRQTLSQLRRTWLPYDTRPIISEGDTIALSPSTLYVDALEFPRLAESADPAVLANASSLYNGELLEGFNLHAPEFDGWLSATRQRYHEKAIELLSRLLDHYIAAGNLEGAPSIAAQLLTLDPLRESSHRTLMELYRMQGRYAAALRQYQICADILRRELNVGPEAGTTALYREIRSLRNEPREASSEIARTASAAARTEGRHDGARPAERRHVTTLTCEIVLDPVFAGLEPDELMAATAGCYRQCSAIIARFGGHVERFSGDRFIAHFGFPSADEHSAERAVRAGLALGAELCAPETLQSRPIATRIGIATSSVVTGAFGDEQADATPALIGAAPRFANVLQAIAPQQAVLIAAATKELVQDLFECSEWPHPILINGEVPDKVWQVRGEARNATRFAALHGETGSPFTGRDDEMEDLRDLWQHADRGEGRIAFLTGEAGIGKSRLALEFQKQIADWQHASLSFQCSPFHGESAFHPFIRELELVADFRPADGDGQKLDKLTALLAGHALVARDAPPLFARLLSIASEDRLPPLKLNPAQQRRKTLGALVDRIESIARREPLLVAFEDCHWADASSLEVLDLLADRIRTLPVLLLITARPGFEPAWGGLEHVHEIALDRMIDGDARELIERLSALRPLAATIVDRIIDKTDGIPLFIEELTQAVLEAGRGGEAPGSGPDHGAAPDLDIPGTLHDLLMARLDRLGDAKAAAQIAAVIGREFSEDLLRTVAGPAAPRLDAALDALGASGLIFEQPAQTGRSFAFKHALIRDTAYKSLPKGRRQQLHGAIAGTIRDAFPEIDKNQPELVARHLTDAGATLPALGYWIKAGVRALSRSSNREAVAHLENGLTLVPLLDTPAEKRRWERQLLAVMGPAVMAVEGYAAAKSQNVFERACDLIDAETPAAEKLRIICGLWNLRSQQGELAAALPLAQEFLSLAQDSHLGVELGNCMMGITLSAMGDFEPAHRHLMDVVESFRLGNEAPAVLFGVDELILAHCYLARVLWSLGYPERAAATAAEGFALTRKGASSVSTALAFIARLFLAVQNPEAGGSEELIADAMAHATEHQLPPFQNWFAFFGAAIRLRQGHAVQALPVMQATIANADSKQNWLFRPFQLGCVAEALLKLGDADRALTAIDEAINTCEATGEKQSEANLYRVKGEVLAALACPLDAEQAIQSGLEIARQQKARTEELRLALSLARLQTAGTRAAEARTALAGIYATFGEGFDLPDLRTARTVLAAG